MSRGLLFLGHSVFFATEMSVHPLRTWTQTAIIYVWTYHFFVNFIDSKLYRVAQKNEATLLYSF